MNENQTICKVDKFIVPHEAKEEFLAKVKETHQMLRQQPGFIKDYVLEKFAGPGEFNVVTLVEWENQNAIDQAKAVIREDQAKKGFNPPDLLKKLGIKADLSDYKHIEF
ncbi:MAG TPA: antibiotic biosynthesis monooxygenase family protein [Bdellovibrio sp.]|uniref:antibiotic biosynthesis monooxygenase family protein n=1 Tax=Bdellovibrio sp. TaxID=28201 RepID=UPI002F1B4F7F